MSPFQTKIQKLKRLNATLQEQWNCTKMTWEDSPDSGEDSSLLVILDSLLTTLERAVDNTSKESIKLMDCLDCMGLISFEIEIEDHSTNTFV